MQEMVSSLPFSPFSLLILSPTSPRLLHLAPQLTPVLFPQGVMRPVHTQQQNESTTSLSLTTCASHIAFPSHVTLLFRIYCDQYDARSRTTMLHHCSFFFFPLSSFLIPPPPTSSFTCLFCLPLFHHFQTFSTLSPLLAFPFFFSHLGCVCDMNELPHIHLSSHSFAIPCSNSTNTCTHWGISQSSSAAHSFHSSLLYQ